jgi:glycosyltransferase involved in cell wall biosynthesis
MGGRGVNSGAPQLVVEWYKKHGRDLIPSPTLPPAPIAAVRRGRRQGGGVNLVGFVRGQMGLGEDVRMASAALEAAGIPHALFDVPPGPAVPQQDNSLAHRLTDRLPYKVTLYCMSAFDMATLYLTRGPAFFAGQYRIGYWPWELLRFPGLWNDVYALVDEIWTGSTFTARSYRAHCPKPVRRLPCPVVLPKAEPVPRRELRLHHADAFAFVYPFDVNSHLARKNPLGLIRAFRLAFPPRDLDVALLLRVNGNPDGHRGWAEVVAESAADHRITILAGTLDRQASLGVVAASDCLVSPHRAEGFGRNIVEAILMGIPVLATAYSGCTDFLAPEEGLPFALTPVREGDYPFGEGLSWAEPSIIEMARRMKKVRRACKRKASSLARRLTLRHSEVATAYSPLVTGKAFAKRLLQIACRISPGK